MTKLSDTQAVILSAASQRDGGAVLPLPETLKLTGGALTKVLGSLEAKGLIEHQGASRGDEPPPLRITRAGLEAIGVAEHEPDGAPVPATVAPQGAPHAQEAGTAGEEPQAPETPAQAAVAPRSGQAQGQDAGGQGEGAQARQDRAGRQAHAARRHQAGAHDRDA